MCLVHSLALAHRLLSGGDDTALTFMPTHAFDGDLHMANLRKSLDVSRDSIAECMLSVGIADIEGYIGDEKPRTDFTKSLDLDRTWIPSTMKALLEPTAFPGASVMVEFQVCLSVLSPVYLFVRRLIASRIAP